MSTNNHSIKSGASTGLQCLGFLVIAGCISTSMTQLNIFLSEIFAPGLFRNVVIAGMSCALIGSQVTMALAVQAIRAKVSIWIVLVALINILFTEGMSITSSQLSFNNNMISATSTQSYDSEEAEQLRKAIARSESRINAFDLTLAESKAENMTNRAQVLSNIEDEERKILQYRSSLQNLNESASSKAFSELPFGLDRAGMASVWAWSLTVGPASISILLGALSWGGTTTSANVTPIRREKKKGVTRGKIKAALHSATA